MGTLLLALIVWMSDKGTDSLIDEVEASRSWTWNDRDERIPGPG